MIKVLGLALYGPLAASTRYRLGQYVPGLARLGIDLQIFHLLGDEYLRRKFSNESLPLNSMARACWTRLTDLSRSNKYDIALLHCELFPLMPGWMERALIRRPYIYDFDDAFYLKYRSGRPGAVFPFLQQKFDKVISGAIEVTAGNEVLTKYAKLHNPRTQYLPTVVDTARYLPQPDRRGGHVFTIGWIGSPSTARYLSELVAPLSTIGQEGAVRFVVIGGKAPHVPNVTVIELEWDESTELDLINSFDVGVMPLSDDEWTRGKCAFKLIQYMACAVPVIASPIGANVQVVRDGCGFMASTQKEWEEALRNMRDLPSRRIKMGEAGRECVMLHYSLHRNLPVMGSVIHNAIR
jgi:glycosyltransferase involved in cell wall biosynthesis